MSEISEAQLSANRVNGSLSHGPATPEGKARSSMNAYRHGLTARKLVLSDEDLELYQALVQSFLDRYQPLADCHWRIDRAMTMEETLKTYLTVELWERTSFTNLSLYVTRFYNMANRAFKQLKELQAERKAEAQSQQEEAQRQLDEAIRLAKYHKMLNQAFDPQGNGFVFSASDLDKEIRRQDLLEQVAMAEKCGFNLAQYRKKQAA